MAEYAEAIMRLEIGGCSERRDEDLNIYHHNYPKEYQRDRRKWGKMLEEEQRYKMNKFTVEQYLLIKPAYEWVDKEQPPPKNPENFYDYKFHYKFNTYFSTTPAYLKTISIKEINLNCVPYTEPFPLVCGSFSCWEPNCIIGRINSKFTFQNMSYPYNHQDDCEIWFLDDNLDVIQYPIVEGFIVLELHMEKKA
jgi:hypothetical protein